MSKNGTVVERLPAAIEQQSAAPPMQSRHTGVVICDMDGLARFSEMVFKSGLAPKGFSNIQAIGVAIQHGLELGLHPLQSLQSIAVINGRPGIYGDAALALVRGSGLLAWIKEELRPGKTEDDYAAVCTTLRVGDPEPRSTAFSIKDAKRAGLWGKSGPWQQYPQRMLMFRARGFNIRDQFPDVLRGIKTVEELQDYADSRQPARVSLSATTQPVASLPMETPDVDAEQPPIEDQDAVNKEARFAEIQERIAAVKTKSDSSGLWSEINRDRDWLGAEATKTLLDQLQAQNAKTWAKQAAKKQEAALLPERQPGEEG